MKRITGKIPGRLTSLLSMMFATARRQADHQKLTRHILALNRHQSPSDIIGEVALCLKDILNYRLFAFVMQKEGGVDVWLDPRVYRSAIENIILADFSLKDKMELNYLNQVFYDDDPEVACRIKDLSYYEINEENLTLRLYIMPRKDLSGHHDDIVHLILQGCAVAISRQLKIDHLRDAALIDPLTGCYNRREFENQLKRMIAASVRNRSSLSVFMFDLDHFKRINDTWGHPAGDQVLREVSDLVRKNMRTGDVLARYGGEEFIAVLPETDKAKAMELAERLRIQIARTVVLYGGETLKITASFGVAQMDRHTDMARLIEDADAMLYKAKLNGRNTVMPGIMKIVPGNGPDQVRKRV